jgi:hypothetical protein
MKPKEWLLKNGHIKEITRGRISRENHALIEKAVRDGASIEGYSVSTAAVKGTETPESTIVKAKVSSEKTVADIGPERFDEAVTVGYIHQDGKSVEISLRTVCNTCGASLTYHVCDSPRIWVDFDTEATVYFKPRTKPLPKIRW